MSNSQSGRMQALFCPLQTFSVGKRRLCFPLQINGARRLGRMLFHALLFGQDPGMNLSAVRSSQSCTGHGSLGVTPHQLQLKAQRSPHLAEVSTQCRCRRKITTLWITNALPTAFPFADLLSDTVLLVRSEGIRAHTGAMELLSFVSLRERCFNLRGSSYGTQFSPPCLVLYPCNPSSKFYQKAPDPLVLHLQPERRTHERVWIAVYKFFCALRNHRQSWL